MSNTISEGEILRGKPGPLKSALEKSTNKKGKKRARVQDPKDEDIIDDEDEDTVPTVVRVRAQSVVTDDEEADEVECSGSEEEGFTVVWTNEPEIPDELEDELGASPAFSDFLDSIPPPAKVGSMVVVLRRNLHNVRKFVEIVNRNLSIFESEKGRAWLLKFVEYAVFWNEKMENPHHTGGSIKLHVCDDGAIMGYNNFTREILVQAKKPSAKKRKVNKVAPSAAKKEKKKIDLKGKTPREQKEILDDVVMRVRRGEETLPEYITADMYVDAAGAMLFSWTFWPKFWSKDDRDVTTLQLIEPLTRLVTMSAGDSVKFDEYFCVCWHSLPVFQRKMNMLLGPKAKTVLERGLALFDPQARAALHKLTNFGQTSHPKGQVTVVQALEVIKDATKECASREPSTMTTTLANQNDF